MRGEKKVTATVRPVGLVEKVKVRPGMWLEFPVGLTDAQKAARIEVFNNKLEASKATPGNYGVNRIKTQKDEPEPATTEL